MEWRCLILDLVINYLLIILPKFYISILFSFMLFGYGFKKYKLKILYMAVITALVSNLLFILELKLGLVVITTLAIAFFMYLIIIKINWVISFFMTFTSLLILIMPDILAETILSQFLDYQLISSNIYLKLMLVFIEYLAILILIYFLHRQNINLSKMVSEMKNNRILGYWLQLFFLIAIQIYILVFLNYTVYVKKYVLFKSGGVPKRYYILFLSIIIIVIFIISFKVIINLKNKYAAIEVSKTERDYNANLEGLLTKLKIERHDNISQVQAIYGMVEEEKYEMLKIYLEDIVEVTRNTSINHVINIKNIPISAFLHTKMECLERRGIDFRINIGTNDAFKEIKSIDLVKIISNILDNAVRAVAEGNIKDPSIELYWGKENNNAVIKITNNGPKINDDIFESLFKEGYTTKEDRERCGYGLAIVKYIIDKYKGKIEIESTEKSTSFTFILPLK